VHIGNDRRVIEQFENERCGNVVGKIADDAQFFLAPEQLWKFKGQSIRAMQCKRGINTEGGQEVCLEVPVELDCVQLAAATDQRASEGALAWANFHEVVLRRGVDGPRDCFDDGIILKKVLPEPFSGLMAAFYLCHAQSHCTFATSL